VGVFFLDFFYGGIMDRFSAETMVGNNVGVRKSDGIPEHKILEQTHKYKGGGQGIPESLYSSQKS
jgi:hypothetical protein